MNATLVALGLRPISLDVCKQEYYDCLNHYFKSNDHSMLLDLLLRCYLDDNDK